VAFSATASFDSFNIQKPASIAAAMISEGMMLVLVFVFSI
jgi:hypothetical protein